MSNMHEAPQLFAPEQYRMRRLDVFDWGTFSGVHEIPIAERGHLFLGRSGTGKSTLLDAMSALLVPPRVKADFNAAARDSEKNGQDRSLVTYIRGAWGESESEGGTIAMRFLREGSTWSAVALQFESVSGKVVTLIQIFWIRGGSNRKEDVGRHYMVAERPFDLRELEVFGKTNFDVRKLNIAFADASPTDKPRAYCDRFSRLFSIDSDQALLLLHKTQSAKNLGDLNQFLRNFMLDRPASFEVADRLVEEFSELNIAHQAVVTARRQVETLKPAREQALRKDTLILRGNEFKELRLGTETYGKLRKKDLLVGECVSLQAQADGLDAEIVTKETELEDSRRVLQELDREHLTLGGGEVRVKESQIAELEQQSKARQTKRAKTEEICLLLGWNELPDSAQAFSFLTAGARDIVQAYEKEPTLTKVAKDELWGNRAIVNAKVESAEKEVAALKRQRSSIPSAMLDMRSEIASALNLKDADLPFVGELLEVKPEQQDWQGAIERVLYGFALSLLVSEEHYHVVSRYINANHLSRRVVYHHVTGQKAFVIQGAANSLPKKLNIKPCRWSEWLLNELTAKFNYLCVSDADALANVERGVTLNGLVRHNKTRHEKDDRFNVQDKANWVLGFDNAAKRHLYEVQVAEHRAVRDGLDAELAKHDKEDRLRSDRNTWARLILDVVWHEVDVAETVARIGNLTKQVKEMQQSNGKLQDVSGRISRQIEIISSQSNVIADRRGESNAKKRLQADYQQKIVRLENDSSLVTLSPFSTKELGRLFEEASERIDLDNVDSVTTKTVTKLSDDSERVSREISNCESAIKLALAYFKREWPTQVDADPTIDGAFEYFDKLAQLEADGLPSYEAKFFALLESQSHQNLAALSTHITQERKAIHAKMSFVTESLARSPFGDDPISYLTIDTKDRQLPEVNAFKETIKDALSNALSDTRDTAEVRFVALRTLVDRLASKDPKDLEWRQTVLDVRQHVEFQGREHDESGALLAIHRGGAGKSGGQRQKLATTILAAALRYQLGGTDEHAPVYAPVVLDEAFSKESGDFTELSMRIFESFGFQMIVATPITNVMTLEPFIGGASVVQIKNRNTVSTVSSVLYDDENHRLDPDSLQVLIGSGEL